VRREPQVTTSIQRPPFLCCTRSNPLSSIRQTFLAGTTVHKLPALSQPINTHVLSLHRPHQKPIVFGRHLAQVPNQLQSVGLINTATVSTITNIITIFTTYIGAAHSGVLVAEALGEEVIVVVAEVAAVEEQPTTLCSFLEREAREELRLALRQAHIAVRLREVLHALTHGVNGDVS